jgi:hypothetical protein
MNDDNAYTITIGDSIYSTSSIDTTFTLNTTTDTSVNLVDNDYNYVNILDNMIDPDRVEKMCKHYPSLRKAWDNFYSIYKMIDQDYKGNIESKEAI